MDRDLALVKFIGCDYVRCTSSKSPPPLCAREKIYTLRSVYRNGQISNCPPSLKLEENPYLLDPRDFEPATEEEYLKQKLMEELR